ncbi:formate dehydrogenase subunit alpha [Deinococcus maricopensis]|uniref:Formate dehydrogenase, alpha subunit n=1 Tax=Deinococcus maricopensis (strain DSM 21211 / LMG 22137 / NRRL B-23946 / LB-34) TaxID=709986 RepID=E8U7D7_DEIML|nr:formate dehydrogenase subunit alpha [Deinococcus maricopensis]ADV66976.1 formate dehydrogenase, alpha subunit [Deinococcus maricopensis DSM 21211]
MDTHITLNGTPTPARTGEPLVDALNRAQLELPQVCYHPQLGPIQTCDTCIVEVDGQLTRACGTPVRAGMQVRTEVNAARRAREDAFDRLLAHHELYCTVCDNNNGNCTVHNTTALMRVQHQTRPFQPKPYAVDDTNPFYRYDPDQCILCGRCVEACQNLQVNETLSINWESAHPRVLWDGGRDIGESSCVSCGHCVTVCPCNALQEKSMLGEAGLFTGIPLPMFQGAVNVVKSVEPSVGYGPILQVSEVEAAAREGFIRKTKTVCTYCGVGCSFDVWTRDRHILKVEPGPGPANGVSTCVKGKFAWDYVNSGERLTTPLIRDGERFREATWDEATALIARRFTDLRAAHGPDALGFIASSKCTNEEAYLVQKLARQVIGTNNVDNCSRYCQSPATMGLWRTVGYGGDSGTIHDIELARLVITVGSNAAESHPVLATRVKRAHKRRGQGLVVVDLREHELARRADVFLRPRAGTDFVWLSAVTKYILDAGLAAHDFLQDRVNGLDEYRASLTAFTLEYAEAVTGLRAPDLRALAHRIVDASDGRAPGGVCILWAMGVTQQVGGSETSAAISNLLLVTGNYGRPGMGAYPLRGHNNVQGASDFGAMPDRLPGYQQVSDPDVRAKFSVAWDCEIRPEAGLNNTTMVAAALDGTLKALYLSGEEMGLTDANADHVARAHEALEFFVVQDVFFTHTARYADVVLPASPSLEKDGTFTNTERRIQRLHAALPPLGDSLPDWMILQRVANALGAGWTYTHPADIMHEAASLTPLFAGVTYDRLDGYRSLVWPVNADGTDTPLLYTERFNFPDGRARLYPAQYLPRVEAPDAQYDLHLNSGRMLEHFHEGNMTFRVPGIAAQVPDAFVEVHPDLARERGVEDGAYVRLVSRHGAVRLRALVTDRVAPGELYVPMNARRAEDAVNRLTGAQADAATCTPAYKDTAVRLEVLGTAGASPLPRTNHRYAHPTPQRGVEVERKWARPDYAFPGSTLNLADDGTVMTGASLNARTDRLGGD